MHRGDVLRIRAPRCDGGRLLKVYTITDNGSPIPKDRIKFLAVVERVLTTK